MSNEYTRMLPVVRSVFIVTIISALVVGFLIGVGTGAWVVAPR